MAFEFRLRRLLEYRQHLVKNVQVQLVTAQQHYQVLYAERDQLRHQIDQQKQIWREHQAQGIPVAHHHLYIHYLKALEQNLLTVEGKLAEALNEVEATRKILLQRETEVQMLESLKTSAREEYRYQELKREQKHLDATAIFADYHKREQV